MIERAHVRGNGEVLRVSLIYLLTGFAMFLAMGLLGLVMRLNHAGWLTVSDDWFYRIMTIHGTGMVSGMLLAGMGGMTAVLSRSVRFSAKWLLIAFNIYFLSFAFVLLAVLVGGFAGAWTALDPLPFHGLTWGLWAGVVMYVGFFFVAIGLLIYCIHLFVTLRAAYGGVRNALGWPRLFSWGRNTTTPTPSPPELAGMVVAMLGILTAVVGASVLIPLFADAAGLIGRVNALYAKNFQMAFGHALANLAIYFAAALVYAILPRFTNRSWSSSPLVVLSWNLVILLVILPTSHHMYADFAQPFAFQILGQVASYAIAPPIILITILGGLSLIYRSGMKWTVTSILIALGIWGWVFGGIAAVIDSTILVNQVTHNTMWVPAHFHTYYLLGVITFIWGYLYYLIKDLSGKEEPRSIKAAAWMYGIGAIGFTLMFFVAGAHSVPRRYARHLPEWQIYAKIAVPFVLLLAVGIGWIAIDILRGLRLAWRETKNVVDQE